MWKGSCELWDKGYDPPYPLRERGQDHHCTQGAPAPAYDLQLPSGQTDYVPEGLDGQNQRLKNTTSVTLKQGLHSLRPPSFVEISPLNALDVNILNNKAKEAMAKKPTWPQTPKGIKRKHESCDQDKTTPTRKTISVTRLIVPRLLTAEQRRMMSAVMSGRNVFFTGSAGTGKSFLLKRILGALAPENTFATASTGVAACQISGITLHAFAGIGSGTAPLQQCIQQASLKQKAVSWKQCKHLIVDEISMVDGEYFQKLEEIARTVRKSDKPFGGIQLILSGDFLQLPPVAKKGQNRMFCFQSSAWENCIDVNIELKLVKRQDDKTFIDLLQDVRKGRSSKELVENDSLFDQAARKNINIDVRNKKRVVRGGRKVSK
ncbi:hypothetical protein JTE90_009281 [Oedothorax gibbosus]|uniref:ATP-dependent DNA helicase n=1 Tax=Oedothorax gibbosus TaxID=931172 RepID=A0AAV6V1T0_9ARAC|nr:hypothetical protein JTE90_009281 [Oedothorax gibbosus]